MAPISKEEFMVILDRQRSNELSIKDFCGNESYTVSSFYYWKSKFGLTRPYKNHPCEALAKNAIRSIAVSRKNLLFCGNKEAGITISDTKMEVDRVTPRTWANLASTHNYLVQLVTTCPK